MEHDSSRNGYHEPEPGFAGQEKADDWGDDFPKTFSVNLIWAEAGDKDGRPGAIGVDGQLIRRRRHRLGAHCSPPPRCVSPYWRRPTIYSVFELSPWNQHAPACC